MIEKSLAMLWSMVKNDYLEVTYSHLAKILAIEKQRPRLGIPLFSCAHNESIVLIIVKDITKLVGILASLDTTFCMFLQLYYDQKRNTLQLTLK